MLGVLLAFILSQGQTLHKQKIHTLSLINAVNELCEIYIHKWWHQPTFPAAMQPVSSTELGLTSVFGMGTGISPIHIDTTICGHKPLEVL